MLLAARRPTAIRDHERAALRLPATTAAARSSRTGWSAGSAAGTSSAATRGSGAWRALRRRLDDPADADAPPLRAATRCPARTTRRSCCARSPRRAGRCTRASRCSRRRTEVLARINPTVGVVESVDDATCVLVTGADSLEIIAVYIGMLGLDFRADGPPELVDHLRAVGRAVRAGGRRDVVSGEEGYSHCFHSRPVRAGRGLPRGGGVAPRRVGAGRGTRRVRSRRGSRRRA